MGGTWLARMLLAIADQPAANPADAHLEAIEPGAFAEWARELGPTVRRPIDHAPRDARVAPGRFEVNPAVYPRRYGSRWSR
jgi:hypothetical protein